MYLAVCQSSPGSKSEERAGTEVEDERRSATTSAPFTKAAAPRRRSRAESDEIERFATVHAMVIAHGIAAAPTTESSLTIAFDGAPHQEERASVVSSVAFEDAALEGQEAARPQEEDSDGDDTVTPATGLSHLPSDHLQQLNAHGLGLPLNSPVADNVDEFCC